MKPILPSLKERKRYLTFKILAKKNLTDVKVVMKGLLDNIYSYLGELGAAKAGVWFLAEKWDSKTMTGIIRVNNKFVNELKAALVLTKEIAGQEILIRSIAVSGILIKADKKRAI